MMYEFHLRNGIKFQIQAFSNKEAMKIARKEFNVSPGDIDMLKKIR